MHKPLNDMTDHEKHFSYVCPNVWLTVIPLFIWPVYYRCFEQFTPSDLDTYRKQACQELQLRLKPQSLLCFSFAWLIWVSPPFEKMSDEQDAVLISLRSWSHIWLENVFMLHEFCQLKHWAEEGSFPVGLLLQKFSLSLKYFIETIIFHCDFWSLYRINNLALMVEGSKHTIQT